MNILDLGGGFPGLEGAKVRFEEVTVVEGGFCDGGGAQRAQPTVQDIWPVCHPGLSALLDFIAAS